MTRETFVTTLKKGIHQGNPLSVFIFCLTIAYILKDFRAAHPSALVTTFVDDIQLIMHRDAIERFPETLARFLSIFSSHGLRFDLSNTAKSSVYSVLWQHSLLSAVAAVATQLDSLDCDSLALTQ